MGDAAAFAAASTSAPATPTSILICREDGSDLFPDADDDGAGADLVVARDDRLLVVDQDDEYVAVLLSKESASAAAGVGTLAQEMEEWMKAARSGCVRWIIKTTAMFRFGGKTAYVAVTYLDRFLAQRRVNVTILLTLHFPLPLPASCFFSGDWLIDCGVLTACASWPSLVMDSEGAGVGIAASRGGVPVAGEQSGGAPRGAAVGAPGGRVRVRHRVHPADGAPRPGHAPVADDRRHPVPLHQLLRGAVPAGRAPADRPPRRGVRLRRDQRDELGGVPALHHRRSIHPRRARQRRHARRQSGRAQGDPGLIMAAIRHRACVLLLQRDGSGGQVVDALGGGGVLGRLCRRTRREPGRLRGHQ